MVSSGSVAVVIPCWNGEKSIKNMLNSLLQQSYQNWIAYIVDDQSQDNSAGVIQQYAKNDDRFHYLIRSREPKGAQTCRNIGLEAAFGAEYICFFDADDRLSPCCLEQRVRYMNDNPELDFGIFPAYGITVTNVICESAVWGFRLCDDSLQEMLQRTLPMVGWTNIYRYDSIVKYRLKWDERLKSLQDSDWNIQAIIQGLRYDYAISSGADFDYFYIVGDKASVSNNIDSISHCQSHICFLSKTVEALSESQRIKYYTAICSYHLWIGELCIKDRAILMEFLHSPWLARNKWVKFRIELLSLLRFRGVKYLFPKVSRESKLVFNEWTESKISYLRRCIIGDSLPKIS